MPALLLSLAIFLFWSALGYAVLRGALGRELDLREALLTPAAGMAAVVLVTGALNRLGLPVQAFGLVLVGLSGALSTLTLIRRAREIHLVYAWPYGLVILLAALLVGRPMLDYGFDWISVANDDMANYCLLAERLLTHGYFDLPDADSYVAGTDYAQIYWFMHVAERARSGSELSLALLWATTGIKAPEIFMSLILACNLALISAVGALSLAGATPTRRLPLIAMTFATLSAMVTLGTILQLIAQVGGLTFLTALSASFLRPQNEALSWRQTTRVSLPPTLFGGGLFLWYPEVIPFFALGAIGYVLVLTLFRRQTLGQYLRQTIVGTGLALMAFSPLLGDVWHFLLKQTANGAGAVSRADVIFPYMLVPDGPAHLWGLLPIEVSLTEPWQSLSIGLGLLLTFALLPVQLCRLIRKTSAAAVIVLVMGVTGIYLFHAGKGFGLFKLAMFAQPFLWATFTQWMESLKGEKVRYAATLMAISLLAINFVGQAVYVERSRGNKGDLVAGSSQHLYQQIKSLIAQNTDVTLVSLTPNIVLAKFQALYGKGQPLLYPSENFFGNIQRGGLNTPYESLVPNYNIFRDDQVDGMKFRRDTYHHDSNKTDRYIFANPDVTVFNKVLFGNNKFGNAYFHAADQLHDYLQLVGSQEASHYYIVYGQGTEAYYSNEPDIFYPGKYMLALGRKQLFRVLGPTGQTRLVMELSASPTQQFANQLPTPTVQGDILPFVGRGAGRVYSRPLTLSQHDQETYLHLDVGRPATSFPAHKTGLKGLYGKDIPDDSRTITVFARNVSLVPLGYYEALTPPSALSRFPDDLSNINLEFSGIYEDSWISEQAFFVLQASGRTPILHLKGMIPMIDNPDFKTTITVHLDGRRIAENAVGLGNFDLSIPISEASMPAVNGRHKVEIRFSEHQTLPGQDGRVIGAKMDFIGFADK